VLVAQSVVRQSPRGTRRKLEVHAWGENRPPRRGAIFRANWREEFERFVTQLRGRNVYITIDLDCLTSAEAITNWENGNSAAMISSGHCSNCAPRPKLPAAISAVRIRRQNMRAQTALRRGNGIIENRRA